MMIVQFTSKKFITDLTEEVKFDHRNYGAWYLNPQKWEKRFHKMSDQRMVTKMKDRRVGKEDIKPTSEKELEVRIDPNVIEGKKHAVKAFRGFLERRGSYDPPVFLKKALDIKE